MLEPDPRFPSGEWTGFYLQHWLPGRHRTDAVLTWQAGELRGVGRDAPGEFLMAGTYDPATGRCEWTKQYAGRHAVAYRGVADSSGVWGVWEINLFGGVYHDRGGFHVWPESRGVSDKEVSKTEAAVLELMRAEFGTPLARTARALGWLAAVGAAGATAAWLATRY